MSPTPAAPIVKNEDSPARLRLRADGLSSVGLPADLHEGAWRISRRRRSSRIASSGRCRWPVLVLLAAWAHAGDPCALRSPRMLAMAALTAALITVNWGTYVWAIGAGHSLDAALGYFINPLFSIFLGCRAAQGEAAAGADRRRSRLAAVAVVVLAFDSGGLPWVALTLAITWGFYAFFRKTLPLGPNQGFFLEVLILSVPALLYILYLEFVSGEGHFFRTGFADTALLLGCGIVTAVPLMIYANGAKLLKLSTIGIMQYIAPTMIFLIADLRLPRTARHGAHDRLPADLGRPGALYVVDAERRRRGR